MNTITYAAVNINNDIRLKSSSGAVFYELAKWTIINGGVVYGAKFGDGWSVVHGHTEKMDGLQDFFGSKYAQSDIRDEFKGVKKDLEQGRMVLFSGTPCQTEGLRCFLGKEYDKLIIIDLICHGVPSPEVWEQYINWVADGRKIKNINFRDKTEGWLDYSLNIEFQDGSFYRKTQHKDLYMKGFLQNIYLRPSCYNCRFKGIERKSDITLADFWGVNNIIPEMFDDKGTSMILIHSVKGKDLWNEVKSCFKFCEVDTKDVVSHNEAAISSVKRTSKRDDFYLANDDKFQTLEKITKVPLKEQITASWKRILQQLISRD